MFISLISLHLTSFRLDRVHCNWSQRRQSGCETTQFAVVATNQSGSAAVNGQPSSHGPAFSASPFDLSTFVHLAVRDTDRSLDGQPTPALAYICRKLVPWIRSVNAATIRSTWYQVLSGATARCQGRYSWRTWPTPNNAS